MSSLSSLVRFSDLMPIPQSAVTDITKAFSHPTQFRLVELDHQDPQKTCWDFGCDCAKFIDHFREIWYIYNINF